ncbi:AAA family ATPase [Flavobacteriaceae bacterium 144Ye]|nr:AAA family ATPase [Flavobacteriaceae bacterium 144Ye]
MKLQTAYRKDTKLKVGISGASGFGKTYSALLLASGMTSNFNKICVIDTENFSASLYSNLGEFKVINLQPPYSPERYIEAIKLCEKSNIEVIIIDSISHEWAGTGGCLEMHEKLGGRFQDWGKISPRHQAFIDTIIGSSCHIITTARRKTDYSLDKDNTGKTKVFKHGTKEITRDGWEYELTINFELVNDNHIVKASKDRTGLFMNKPEFIINKTTGQKLIEWYEPSEKLKAIYIEIQNCESVEGLKHIYQKHPSEQKRIYSRLVERKKQLNAIIDEKEIHDNLKKENNE